MPLSATQFQQIVDLLQQTTNPAELTALLQTALHGCAVLHKIKPADAMSVFVPHVVTELDKFGECEPSKPAVVALLEALKGQVGLARQDEINALLLDLGQKVRFKDYRLMRQLGSGGNGAVWLVERDLPDGTALRRALKTLHRNISSDPVRVERFRREIGIAARLGEASQSLHILPVYDWGEVGGRWFVVMKYIEGQTLRAAIAGKVHTLEQALLYLEPLARALDDAHSKNVIHRDVKPENVLLGDRLYLTDFGLAFSTSGGSERVTRSGERPGTGRYMAPEQWREQELTIRTDLYALAILAYELLTGKLPFIADNDQDRGEMHCHQDLPEDTTKLAPELLAVLRRGAAKHPADRYASAGEFVHQLKNWEAGAETLLARSREYTDDVYYQIQKLLIGKFVELSGDERTLQPAPQPTTKPAFTLHVYDLFEESAQLEADHLEARHDSPKTYVSNVRERLHKIERGVLVGEPGAGKTWLLLRLMVDSIEAWRTNPQQARVPLLIWLNRFKGETSFAEYVRASALTVAPYLDQLRRENRLLLLCDALNEMPQQHVAEVQAYLQDKPHFIVSCRVRDYHEQLKELHPLEQVHLRELELPAIKELITKRLPGEAGLNLWQRMGGTEGLERFWQAVNAQGEGVRFWDVQQGAPSYTSSRDDAEWRKMHQGARLIPLSRNPFMAQLVCRVAQASQGHLPANRYELFQGFVAELLRREAKNAHDTGRTFPPADQIESALVELAKALQQQKVTVLPTHDAALQPIATKLFAAAVDANLLTSDETSYKFSHQLLQEYYAVRVLEAAYAQGITAEQFFADKLEDRWNLEVWRETILIWGEFRGGAAGANEAVRWLAPYHPDEALNIILRHGAGFTLNDVEVATQTQMVDWARATLGISDPRLRGAAYRIIGRWSTDTRPGVGLRPDGLPDIEWIAIPAGEFIYGEGKEKQKLTLPTFQIAKYPVTYVQFQAFIEAADGFHDPQWWHGLAADAEHKAQPGKQAFKFGNHPRENVSWYHAMAFTRWLSAKLGYEVRLPTEFEWEKAARGTGGRIYPYGNEFDAAKGNTFETGIGQTSAVGIFPEGASPYGVLDMSGNVWQWCLSEYRNSKLNPSEEQINNTNTYRVLRGGSWEYGQSNARAAYRSYDISPDLRNGYIGFRLVRPPSQ